MRLTVRKVQAALTSLGFNPGAIDGVWGDRTEGALIDWGDSVYDRTGETYDYVYSSGGVDILPPSRAQTLEDAARDYELRNPGSTAEPARRTSTRTADAPLAPPAPPPALALPFLRVSNPWAWLLGLLGLSGLGWGSYMIARRMRRR